MGSVRDISLFLPSAVMLGGGLCSAELLEIEWKLRASQGLDELENLRKYLLSRTAIFKYKLRYGHGQYDGLRSAKAIETISAKIEACAARYRLHHVVLIQATPLLRLGGTETVFKEFRVKDTRGIDCDAMDAEHEAETDLLWIWLGEGIDPSDQETINESLRIAWCKSRALAHRWQEEGLLVQEEMRRTIETFEYKAREWEQRGTLAKEIRSHSIGGQVLLEDDSGFVQGRAAYTARQAAIRWKLRDYCNSTWSQMLSLLRSGVGDIGHWA
ncbi:hypothetical protein BDP27DRAFT_1452773 [Rhodocollybia butyracea]|uniref:Uncharacterized protein n=1 Tax=Rhodocollybia butyracea TaxID=206335 RepID=A0A9P5PDY2_9AGAR|nr:hypothetical protein BDP27DRAFT_1452773 [Rhodocollybia butyracea]